MLVWMSWFVSSDEDDRLLAINPQSRMISVRSTSFTDENCGKTALAEFDTGRANLLAGGGDHERRC
jgi:hypothetical protein